MRLAAIYGAGAVMGFTPQEVDAMSVWQYMAARDGYMDANCPDSEGALTDQEQDELWDWLQAKA